MKKLLIHVFKYFYLLSSKIDAKKKTFLQIPCRKLFYLFTYEIIALFVFSAYKISFYTLAKKPTIFTL